MITRENYQEFFLLYIDNELSAADARAVEEWVEANPDLEEEWESLQLCRVDPGEELRAAVGVRAAHAMAGANGFGG